MRNAVMLLEKVLNETVNNEKYRVQIRVAKHGNLPGRTAFIRKVYRQSSLHEFMDSGVGETIYADDSLDIIYTIQARNMKEDKIGETHELLKADLDNYLWKVRTR